MANSSPDLSETVALNISERVRRVEEAVVSVSLDADQLPQVSGYLFLKLLGEGGCSKVYLAHDELSGENVALKVLRIDSQDRAMLRRFIQEFTIFSTERHPSITRLIDRGFTTDFAYITMEYFPCGDLANRIASGLGTADAVSIVSAIAQGLGVAHARSVIHRDIKPGNIMFRADGSVAITDFGIAKLNRGGAPAQTAHTMTQIGQSIGTPYYMSPEQIDGSYALDHRTDLYSLGVLFFECLTGEKPFRGGSLAEMLDAHLNGSVPRLPKPVERYQAAVNRLMSKKAEDRFQNAEEFVLELQRIESTAAVAI